MRILAAAVATLLFLSCAGNIQPTRQLDDAALSQRVRDAFQGDPALRSYEITVNANSGTVTLLGVVDTTAQRDRAGQLASEVQGVTRVENLLTVK
jgi:hyperosmotically inducible periplasmic protein